MYARWQASDKTARVVKKVTSWLFPAQTGQIAPVKAHEK